MNFFEKCKCLMDKTKEFKDLKDDFKNLQKWEYYVQNYSFAQRNEIINFILDVRINNIVFAVGQQIRKLANSQHFVQPRSLHDLDFYELFTELQAEYFNILSKGAYDCINSLKNIQQENTDLAKRIATLDDSIFLGLI